MDKKYYIATAIAYASGKPHIGNTYEIILADAIARFKRLEGYDVYFQTGTDEHGQKIENKAIESGLEPQKFVDEVTDEIKSIFDVVNTSYDAFVRTTDPKHEKIVQDIFKKLYEQGDIYKGNYEGLYCTPCESFFTASQAIENICPDCGRALTEAKEEAYFFKLSKYQKQLEEYIETNSDFLVPASRKNEMVNNFLKPGLQDLCVSRTSFKWGVPVNFDDKHVIYVWVDALSNYITFLDYDVDGNHGELFNKYWPCDVHLIGKDIFRFHAIYWIIMLMALGIEIPKKVFGHPWLLMNGDKMSKSKGNLLYADDLVEKYGVDVVRYYVLSETSYANDGIITEDLIVSKFNSDLANTLGNLVNRSITMANKYFLGKVINTKQVENIDKELTEIKNNLLEKTTDKINNLEVGSAINEIFELLRRANKYVDETEPWILFKNSKLDRLETVIFNLLDAIRVATVLLQPFMPDVCEKIFDQLGVENKAFDNIYEEIKYNINEPEVLFKRIEN